MQAAKATLILLFLSMGSQGYAKSLRGKLFSDSVGKRPAKLKLFDVETGKGTELVKSGPLLPNRVYLAWHEKDKIWYYVLADFAGDIAIPLELIRSGSVLPGKYLGAKDAKQNYMLNRNAEWTKSFLEEQHYFWVLSEKPRIKIVGFKPLIASISEEDKQ